MFRKFSKAYKKYKERRSGSQETSSGVTSTAAAPTPDDSSAWDTADSSQFRTSLSSAFKRKKGREGHSHSSSDPTPLRYARDLLDGPTVTLAAVPPRSKLKPPADTSPLSPGARGEKWEKVLWKTTSFPDNYTDQTFLKELVSRWRCLALRAKRRCSGMLAPLCMPCLHCSRWRWGCWHPSAFNGL